MECLEAQGVERAFCVPGESYLEVLDALADSRIATVVARQEGGAAMMAEAEGKMTGRPGVAMVTRGPGSTNAASGVHVARQDSTPMVLFVGQIGRGMKGRDAFQEVDYRQTFRDLAKWVEEIDDADRIPEIVGHAFHVAMSGRPGPVVLALAGGHADEHDRGRCPPAARRWPNRRRRRRRWSGSARSSRARGGLSSCSAARAGTRRRSPACTPSPRGTTCPSASPSAARGSSTTPTRTTPATSASASIRS